MTVVGEPSTTLGRLYAAAGRRMGDQLLRELVATAQLTPRRTPARMLATAIAVVVHLSTVGLADGGALLLVLARSNPFAVVAGIAALGAAWVIRPRLGSSKATSTVDEATAPTLYALIDAVAAALDVAAPDAVVLDGQINASWSVRGWRRRRVLTLGLPLLAMLGPQERVALLAHELAHDRNGDVRRGIVLGAALDSLIWWVDLLDDEQRVHGHAELTALAEPLARGLVWLLARPAYAMAWVQAHLLFRDSQRAEYLADHLAADVAGSAAVVALHDALLAESRAQTVIQRAALTGERTGPELFADIRASVVGIDAADREALRERGRKVAARLDDSHPILTSRIALLERRTELAPRVTATPGESRRIDDELAALFRRAAAQVLDRQRSGMYYGRR